MRLRRSLVLPFLFLLSSMALFIVCAKTPLSDTISILEKTYRGEMEASRAYFEFANKSDSEGYPEISHLFRALSSSESIHARNAKQILDELGVKVKEIPKQEITVLSTQENLQKAATSELNEIEKVYPEFLKRIKSEGHEGAQRVIAYAWESEKQHHDLIKTIKKVSSFSATIVSRELKRAAIDHADYFICQVCGSTLVEPPEDSCPVCKSPGSQYKKVEKNKLN